MLDESGWAAPPRHVVVAAQVGATWVIVIARVGRSTVVTGTATRRERHGKCPGRDGVGPARFLRDRRGRFRVASCLPG